MKGQFNTQLGAVRIDTDVIAKYAGSIVVESFGIVGMAEVNVKDGFARLLKKDNLTKGINVTMTEEGLDFVFKVIVAYGVSISTVADNLISHVTYQVEKYTGIPVHHIDILVEGVRVID